MSIAVAEARPQPATPRVLDVLRALAVDSVAVIRVDTLAEQLGVSERTVQRAVAALERDGRVTRRRIDRHGPNAYRLL